MDVEALAVAKIGGMLARCQHLKAFIPTNDKTPFTDGHIDLYTGLRQSKADWRGRVPIQVKGRTRRSKKTLSPTHPITRTDLRAYQKDSGVLFFVVTVDPKSGRRGPYYALLSPFAIEWILDGVPDEQLEVSVPLKKLPNNPNEIEDIVTLALKTRDQNMSIGFDPVLFERLQSITVHTASTLNLDAPVTLAPGATDFALVLNTADGLSVPLGGELRIFPQDYYAARHIDLQVQSGAITYNGVTIMRTDEETFELVISEGLTLTLRTAPGQQSTNVSLTLEPTLAGRLKAVEFYTALLDTGAITFNDTPSPIAVTADAEDADLRKHLVALRDMSTLFAHLGVDTRLVDLPQIDDTQVQQLSILYRGFVRGEEIADPSAETSRILQQVGPWNLLFLITPGSAPDKWRLVDPFSPEVRQQFQWASNEEDAQTIPITAYDIVEEDHLPTVLNMRLESIVGAYETIADSPSTYDLANQRMLTMIAAADSSETREEFLGAAGALNDWLIAEQGPEPHHLINRWQIAARREALSVEQRSEIRALKRQILSGGATNAGQLELACAILLGDAEEIDDLTKQLPEERLLQLRGWPIWKLNQTPS